MIAAALALAAERGWRSLSLAEIAAAAGVGLDQAYAAFPSKGALLAGIMASIDQAMLKEGAADPADQPRDRLFEVLMRGFDTLQANRAGIRAIIRDLPADPLTAALAAAPLMRSAAWVLEAAGVPSAGPIGRLKRPAIAAILLSALRVWLDDDSPDMARTMARLDRDLREAEGLVRRCPLLEGGRRTTVSTTEPGTAAADQASSTGT
jgi:AcrR family transcriptional regulator